MDYTWTSTLPERPYLGHWESTFKYTQVSIPLHRKYSLYKCYCHKNTSFLLLKSNLFCLLFSNESLVSNVELPLTPSVEEYSSADEPEDVENMSNDTEEGENRYIIFILC